MRILRPHGSVGLRSSLSASTETEALCDPVVFMVVRWRSFDWEPKIGVNLVAHTGFIIELCWAEHVGAERPAQARGVVDPIDKVFDQSMIGVPTDGELAWSTVEVVPRLASTPSRP
jgi:hypothetical protein